MWPGSRGHPKVQWSAKYNIDYELLVWLGESF